MVESLIFDIESLIEEDEGHYISIAAYLTRQCLLRDNSSMGPLLTSDATVSVSYIFLIHSKRLRHVSEPAVSKSVLGSRTSLGSLDFQGSRQAFDQSDISLESSLATIQLLVRRCGCILFVYLSSMRKDLREHALMCWPSPGPNSFRSSISSNFTTNGPLRSFVKPYRSNNSIRRYSFKQLLPRISRHTSIYRLGAPCLIQYRKAEPCFELRMHPRIMHRPSG